MKIRSKIIGVLYANNWMKWLVFNPFVEYHQWRLLRFVENAASSIREDQSIIDVGAGELKYKENFSHCNYVSNDLCIGDDGWSYSGVDIISSVYDIPVEEGSFDAVLCIQVLEHLDRPDLAFFEFCRILKPGGRVYLSAPLLAGEHQQPYDFFRYTRYGYQKLAERSGFKVISAEPHGGGFIAVENLLWATFWEIVPIRRQTVFRYLMYLLLYPLKFLIGMLVLLLDGLDRKKSMTINYDVILEKVDKI